MYVKNVIKMEGNMKKKISVLFLTLMMVIGLLTMETHGGSSEKNLKPSKARF